ncbi:MAG TPA: hypothetical protein VGJ03_14665 [Acidimicrobiales bacterium]
MQRFQRRLAVVVLIGAVMVAGTGAAVAGVSGGNYSPSKQHCSGGADDSNRPQHVEKGCQSSTANVSDGSGNEAFFAGTQQTADGDSAHDLVHGGDPASVDPTSGAQVYFGADDNLDNGEHDSSSKIKDGPSDGGAVALDVSPESVMPWLAALRSGDIAYLLTHPAPLVDAGAGSCADGTCESVQTQQRTAYQGGGKGQRDAANYDGTTWDPDTCAGPSDTSADCGPGGIKSWWNKDGTVHTEPGAQVYEDPNPEGSPEGPYPLPAAYAGTCGVIAGGGTAPAAPASPITNGAGQVVVSTGC